MKRKEFEQKKDELRKRLENAKDEELEEIRKEADELENVEIEEENENHEEQQVDQRSLLRATVERLEKRSASLSDVKEIKRNNIDKEEEKRISEKAEELRAGKAIKLSTGIEKRAVTVSGSGVLVPAKTKREIADSYDKPSSLVDKIGRAHV